MEKTFPIETTKTKRMARADLAKGFLSRTFSPRFFKQQSRGFSLIEMMIVLALIGIIAGMGSTYLASPKSKLKSAVRVFASKMKRLRQRALIDNTTYRLVFEMPEDRDLEHTYWVESSTSAKAKVISEEELEEEIDALEEAGEEDKDPQGFKIVDKPKPLPRGLKFESIEVAGLEEAIDSGRAYIFFFPQGRVQESAIHITDGDKMNWTLLVHPLTARTEIVTKYVSLEDTIEE